MSTNVYDIRTGRPISEGEGMSTSKYQTRNGKRRERSQERRTARRAKYSAPTFDPGRLMVELSAG